MLQESCVQCEVTVFHLGGGSSSVEELKDIVMHMSLSRNRDQVWRLYQPLIVSPLFLYLLPSLICNCLNPLFRTQARSRRLNEACILQTRNGEHRTDLYSRAPQSSTQFKFRELGNYDSDNILSKWSIGLPQLGEQTLNWKYF